VQKEVRLPDYKRAAQGQVMFPDVEKDQVS
jgi:hypothetical protein